MSGKYTMIFHNLYKKDINKHSDMQDSIDDANNMNHEAKYIESFEDLDTERGCMIGLWRAVITQALMDASSNSKKPLYKGQRIKARNWLRGRSEEFRTVCMLADLDPQYVQHKARIAIQQGCKWRKEGGNVNLEV